MLKIAMTATVLLASGLAASAQSHWGWNGGHGWSGYGARGGYDSYAAEPMYQPRYQLQPQSGGNGSPVSAGSLRGSTDRSSPDSPFASGPYGDGPVMRRGWGY